jgi:hypothetical protein
MQVELSDGASFITIEPPFTLEFEVKKNTLASLNSGNFVIYNLNAANRNQIFMDRYDTSLKDSRGNFYFRSVQFKAGYKNSDYTMLPMIFNGDLRSAYSYREGPNYRTELGCFEMSAARTKAKINTTLPASKAKKTEDILKEIVKSFAPYNIKKSVIDTFAKQVSQRGVTLFGSPIDILNELVKNKFYFDDDTILILEDDAVIPGEISLITSDSGLLGTPKRSKGLIEFDMLFEPRLRVSQLVELKSRTEPAFNGQYKLVGLEHRGTISENVCGDAVTSVTLTTEGKVFRPVNTSTPTNLGNIA